MGNKIYILVGTAPLAVANSIVWHLKTHKHLQKAEITFCITNEQEKQKSESEKTLQDVYKLLEQYKQYYSFLESNDLVLNPKLVKISEFDLLKNIRILTKEITKETNKNDAIFLESTAGRKVMVSSIVLTGAALKEKKYNVNLLYYWLKTFRVNSIDKTAYDLYDDEAESFLYDLKDLFNGGENIE